MILTGSSSLRLGKESKPAEIQMLRLSRTTSVDPIPAQRPGINPLEEAPTPGPCIRPEDLPAAFWTQEAPYPSSMRIQRP
ncbi:rCG58444 [Rattus norvegicus]|uniref:RCG58444 n=1 Tax=Rattus norvegicus TaxID=10116 RepID=A6J554_RAT|nr:rCG58444 [Rattus norvegicus]